MQLKAVPHLHAAAHLLAVLLHCSPSLYARKGKGVLQEVDVARLWTHLVRARGLTTPTAQASEGEQSMEVDEGSGSSSAVM